jgi:chromosome segregation ATPase
MDKSDKMFELLEKMYIQLQENSRQLEENTKRLDNLEQGQAEMKADIKKIDLKIDNEINDKIRGLYDARSVMNDRLDIIDEKLDKLQIDVNSLTVKTAYNDTRIIEISRDLKKAR